MISDDNSTDGKSFHRNSRNKGSFRTVRVGSRSLPLYPSATVCLGLLNALLMLTAVVIGIYCGKVTDVSTSHQLTAEVLIMEVKQLLIMQNEAISAKEEAQQALQKGLGSYQQLKLQLMQNRTLSDDRQRQLETLQLEKATLQSNTSNIRDSCGRCQSGWLLFNSSCYFYSKSASVPKLNWHESRQDCISRGANLTVIETLEEQRNLFDFLPKLDSSIRHWWSVPGGTWIGLTDSHKEGHWVWLNNVTVQDRGYWIAGEPNNHGAGEGEDCAALMNMRNPWATWFDASCQDKRDWLCEMEPN